MEKLIGIIGDSISEGYYDETDSGWVSRLHKKLPLQYTFINMSKRGDTVIDAYNKAYYEALSKPFDLIIITVGTNDCKRRKESNLQPDLSEGIRIKYWNKMLDILSETKAKIVVTDILPVMEERYKGNPFLRYNTDIEKYNVLLKNICTERNIPFFTRYENWKNKNLSELFKDATHPNSDGHSLIADEIYEYLKNSDLI